MTDLHDEILNGPLKDEIAAHVASGADSLIADILNRKDITALGPVSSSRFSIWLASTGVRATVKDLVNNTASPLRSSAIAIEDLVSGSGLGGVLDLAEPQIQGLLSAWAAAGVITEAQKDELLALGQTFISRAEQLGITVDHTDVARALRG